MAEFNWKAAVATIAPFLGNALPLPPPLGSMAAKFIADKVLGKPDATEAELHSAIENASPETIAKFQEADAAFKLRVEELKIDLQKAQLDFGIRAMEDIQNARAMQIATKDWIPRFLAIFVSLTFLAVLVALVFYGAETKANEPLLILLGSLGTAWTSIIAYYFGSSAGSARKTDLLVK